MPKRQLDAFFDVACVSTPKPHAHCPVAARGLIKRSVQKQARSSIQKNTRTTPEITIKNIAAYAYQMRLLAIIHSKITKISLKTKAIQQPIKN
jgi:hypothetical protein